MTNPNPHNEQNERKPRKKNDFPRALSTQNIFDKKYKHVLEFQNPLFERAFGPVQRKGMLLIYGPEKNGKTWLALQLAKDLAATEKVAYISAEEGADMSFKLAIKRAGITTGTKIAWEEYIPIETIVEKYSKPRTADVIFIDNLSVYNDEITSRNIKRFVDQFPNKLFIPIAHFDRGVPQPASARQAKKFARAYVEVKGATAFVVSRFAPQGGVISINDDLSEMYWGDSIQES